MTEFSLSDRTADSKQAGSFQCSYEVMFKQEDLRRDWIVMSVMRIILRQIQNARLLLALTVSRMRVAFSVSAAFYHVPCTGEVPGMASVEF